MIEMTFDEAYKEVESEFQELISEEGSIYLPLTPPKGPVDFVLVAMEPSLGFVSNPAKLCDSRARREAKEKIDCGVKNFAWSINDFILHYCIQSYLCQDDKTYYLTDLAKGAMLTKEAAKDPITRYKKWYPTLEKELGLVAKPDVKIVSIGGKVRDFLAMKGLYGHAGSIRHYSGNALAGVLVNHQCTHENGSFPRAKIGDVLKVAQQVMRDGGMSEQCAEKRCRQFKKTPDLSKARQALICEYKTVFERVRNQHNLSWRRWQPHWESRLSST